MCDLLRAWTGILRCICRKYVIFANKIESNKYIYTSIFCPKAFVVATYQDGNLSALTGIQHLGLLWESIPINSPIPFRESEVERMAGLYDYAISVKKL